MTTMTETAVHAALTINTIAMPRTLETALDNTAAMIQISMIITARTIGMVLADTTATTKYTSMSVNTAAGTATTNTVNQGIPVLTAVVTTITITRQIAALVKNAMDAKVKPRTTTTAEILRPATKKSRITVIAMVLLPLLISLPTAPNQNPRSTTTPLLPTY